jgi:hypothetical protein
MGAVSLGWISTRVEVDRRGRVTVRPHAADYLPGDPKSRVESGKSSSSHPGHGGVKIGSSCSLERTGPVKTPHPDDLLKAEKQVLTGIYVRLLKRYSTRMGPGDARALAGAVTGSLLCLEPADEGVRRLMDEHRDLVEKEVTMLASDEEIRRMATDTVVLKTVYMNRQRSCKDESAQEPVEHLKRMGVFLPGEKAPTAAGFIDAAKAFYSATPW